MTQSHRRDFLKILASAAAVNTLPGSLARALALPANNRTGTIEDVEHIVVLMQENRSFDHYFGALKGVRGFNDPRAVILPSGKSVWHQPDGQNGEVLPYRPDVPNVGMEFLPDPPHGWGDSHDAWNNGKYDQWVPAKGQAAMAYLTRRDAPYHYALADAFTICDAYYCSLLGPTDPNRYHMWTGWVGNDGKAGGPVISNAELGYDWSTYPERLQRAGVSWKVYQDVGVGLDAAGYWGWTDDAYIGNYGDNSLLYFHQYQNALPGTPLADFAKTGTDISKTGTLFDVFRNDVRRGKLPKVSYIVAPEALSEHPNWPANYGAWYISQIIDILTANPEVWAKTALFLTYDENGGYFDHLVPPTPPQSAAQGLSTVSTINEIFPGDAYHASGPYGLGIRVPMVAISPWTKGGYVNSQVFDHTSLIRFMEARFGLGKPDLIEQNITPWRRAVVGDLTSIFNFKTPNAALVALPGTASYIPPDRVRHPDDNPQPPLTQRLPEQEAGIRPARALPYELQAHGKYDAASGNFMIELKNTGFATAVFHVRTSSSTLAPRSYTVEPGKSLSDIWAFAASSYTSYEVSVYGPNGFTRHFQGNTSSHGPLGIEVIESYDRNSGDITLSFHNPNRHTSEIKVRDHYTREDRDIKLAPNGKEDVRWNLKRQFGWYDLSITLDGDSSYRYQFAGHVETGMDSMSDPKMGQMTLEN